MVAGRDFAYTGRLDHGSMSAAAENDYVPGQPGARFEPYVRLETSRARHTGGTGLGLAIARAIARGHGGDVALESREGGGLRAVLKFPRRWSQQPGAAVAAGLGVRA